MQKFNKNSHFSCFKFFTLLKYKYFIKNISKNQLLKLSNNYIGSFKAPILLSFFHIFIKNMIKLYFNRLMWGQTQWKEVSRETITVIHLKLNNMKNFEVFLERFTSSLNKWFVYPKAKLYIGGWKTQSNFRQRNRIQGRWHINSSVLICQVQWEKLWVTEGCRLSSAENSVPLIVSLLQGWE